MTSAVYIQAYNISWFPTEIKCVCGVKPLLGFYNFPESWICFYIMILHWGHLSTFTSIHALLSFMNSGGL